ncbi:MAG TPA: guanosine monophosphate reductase [Patescibacteria group bacterium]
MSKTFYQALGKKTIWPKLPGSIPPTSITYADVNLIPQNTNIMSRKDIDTSVKFGPYNLKIPFIGAPMDTVMGEKMIRELDRLGALGTLPRPSKGFEKENLKIAKSLIHDKVKCVYVVGLKTGLEEAQEYAHMGAEIVLIDIAHGGMKQVKDLAKKIKTTTQLTVIAGNIVTFEQALEYKDAGIDIARVGVGPGSVCITRMVAGTGFPQLSAIFETTSTKIPVIADGGIKYPGDFAKAIAAGAIIAMGGSMLAGTVETPGDVIHGEKVYRGQASESYMKDHGSSVNGSRSAEGITTTVRAKGPVEGIMNDFLGGLKSAMSYAGAKTIKEFQKKAIFNLSSPAVQIENTPHFGR